MVLHSSSGNIVQTIYNYNGGQSTVEGVTKQSNSFVEVDSRMRIEITPKFSNSRLLIQYNFLFGGNNSSAITTFRIHSSTDNFSSNSVVSSLNTEGNRNFGHASHRLVDFDINDRHTTQLLFTTPASNTNARKYSLFALNESNVLNYYHRTGTNNAGCSATPPSVIVQEIGQ
tara:strand:- start:380 stop:895 length:516 start_codon:yes stop_codon:yes gene_type:complete